MKSKLEVLLIVFIAIVIPLSSFSQYHGDIRGTDDDTDGAEVQFATPSGNHYLRFFSGRNLDPKPYIYFSDLDTFRIANGVSNFSNFTERLTILPNGFTGISMTKPQSMLHVQGNITTPWGVQFNHYVEGWEFNNLPYLKKGWTSNIWDFLYLGSTGSRDNNVQGAMMLSHRQGILFGKGHNDASQL